MEEGSDLLTVEIILSVINSWSCVGWSWMFGVDLFEGKEAQN